MCDFFWNLPPVGHRQEQIPQHTSPHVTDVYMYKEHRMTTEDRNWHKGESLVLYYFPLLK